MSKIDEIKPDNLELDLDNPRFGLTDASSESEALKLLAMRADLRELWDSINQRTFERYEPLVAFQKPNGKFIVVEGNRRLAAVKSLLNPTLLEGTKISPPALADTARASIETLPVIIVARREDADDYIGFKHINGPSTWGALAKAKFGVKLFEKTVVAPGEADTRIQSLSKRLGDSRQLILRSLIAYKIFEQAKSSEMVDEAKIADNALDFSHLYTMIQNPATRAYLGLTEAPLNESLIKDNPIPASHIEHLAHLMGWLFGNSTTDPIIKSQGTDRPKLTKVLASRAATETLERTGDFERAADEAGFRTDSWLDSVVKLSTMSKRVSDGVTELPPDLEREAIDRAKERLTASERNITAAKSLLASLFK
jgi:hypothetical protein